VANIKSQKKRILTNAKATLRNRATKSEVRTRIKNAVDTIGTDDNPEALRLAVKRLDMASAKRVIHRSEERRVGKEC
jgi:small subunit ribosomal protein S20